MNSTYVSRAGEKLEFGLKYFNIQVADKTCADFGANTGGFTDCLLQHSAKKVFAIETGYGVLDLRLRNDSRVAVMERTNAIDVNLPQLMDIITIDVGWTPQRLIVPQAIARLKDTGDIISLLKPHYEAPKEWLIRGKLITEKIPEILLKVKTELAGQGVTIRDMVESPIAGKQKGNIEYLLWIRKA
jgi:23S rRNA (cytidine1920-2'-O)/16S rRNA (cytidine1409-2'-O)-methyltransferase